MHTISLICSGNARYPKLLLIDPLLQVGWCRGSVECAVNAKLIFREDGRTTGAQPVCRQHCELTLLLWLCQVQECTNQCSGLLLPAAGVC